MPYTWTYIVLIEEECSSTGAATAREVFRAFCAELPNYTSATGGTAHEALQNARKMVEELMTRKTGRRIVRIQSDNIYSEIR